MPNAYERAAVGGMRAEGEKQAQLETNFSISQGGRWWRRCRQLSGPFRPITGKQKYKTGHWTAAHWGVCHQFQNVVWIFSMNRALGHWLEGGCVTHRCLSFQSPVSNMETSSYNSGEEIGFTWLVSFCLRPSPWGFLAHGSKGIHAKLHRCSAAICFHHGKEEESGHCLLLSMLQPRCRGCIQVALGNRTTHSFPIFHQERGNRLSMNGTGYCPRVLVPTMATPWNHMGSEFYRSFYLPLPGWNFPRARTSVCFVYSSICRFSISAWHSMNDISLTSCQILPWLFKDIPYHHG